MMSAWRRARRKSKHFCSWRRKWKLKICIGKQLNGGNYTKKVSVRKNRFQWLKKTAFKAVVGGGMRDGEDGVDGDQNTETKKTIKPSNSKRKWWKIIKMSYNWWALKVSPINTWAHEQSAVQISTGKWCKIDRPRDRRFLKRAQKANTRRYNRTCTTTLSLLYPSRSFSFSFSFAHIYLIRAKQFFFCHM